MPYLSKRKLVRKYFFQVKDVKNILVLPLTDIFVLIFLNFSQLISYSLPMWSAQFILKSLCFVVTASWPYFLNLIHALQNTILITIKRYRRIYWVWSQEMSVISRCEILWFPPCVYSFEINASVIHTGTPRAVTTQLTNLFFKIQYL